MKTELKNTHSKFDGAINQFEKLGQQIKDKDKRLEEMSKIQEENKELKEINEKFSKAIKTGETKEEYLVKPAEEYYDVVVDIDSINSLKNDGWQIKYNKERKDIYDKIISEETMKIGVLGLNNVGKSYLLSKLVKSEIPTGYSIETKGISIKYAVKNEKEKNGGEINGVCILDSIVLEYPLLREDMKEVEAKKENDLENAIKIDNLEEELAKDKAQTE